MSLTVVVVVMVMVTVMTVVEGHLIGRIGFRRKK
jgi:hypothetical protein